MLELPNNLQHRQPPRRLDDGSIQLPAPVQGAPDRVLLSEPADYKFTGHEDPTTRQLLAAFHYLRKGGLPTLKPLLPLMLALKGKPYRLERYFPFEPLFRTRVAKMTLMKTGRQVSKCGHLYTDVIRRADGRQVSVSDLRSGDEVLSYDGGRFVGRKVVNIWRTGLKQSLRVRTRLGAEFEVTADHRMRVLGGYRTAGELRAGDRLMGVRRGGAFGALRLPRSRIILTAYMIGDGCCGCSGNWSMTGAPGPVLDEFQALADELEAQGTIRRERSPGNYSVVLHKDNCLIAWLREDGCDGKRAYDKCLPSWAFALPREDTVLFLSRLWATDGMVKPDRTKPQITYTSTSQRLARDVRSLLNKLGIPASIKRRKTGYRKDGVYRQCRDAFVVRVETRDGWSRFLAEVDVPGKPAFELRDVAENNNRDTVPIEVNAWIAELAEATRWKHADSLQSAGLRHKPKYPLTYAKLARYVAYFERVNPDHPRLADLKSLLTGDVIWDEIVAIEDAGALPTCDVEVEGTHNYVLDGVVSHNSTSLAAQGLMMANSIPHFSTLFVTPLYEMIRRFSQNYVRRFIEESPVKSLFVGKATVNSVLQKTFKNFSQLLFSFAYLDAERTRGISADKNCLVAGTPVELADGRHVPIERVKVGSVLVSADKDGSITLDRVTGKIDQGVQRVYEVEFTRGQIVRCTADERFLSSRGRWVYLSELFDGPPPSVVGHTARLVAGADALRVFARRRGHLPFESNLVVADLVSTRHEARSVLPAQVGSAGGLRHDAGTSNQERRLGQRAGRVHDRLQRGVRHRRQRGRPGGEEARHPGLDGHARLGGDRVLADGRRCQAVERPDVLHARVHGGGGRTPDAPSAVDGTRISQDGVGHRSPTLASDHPSLAGRRQDVVRARSQLGSPDAQLQASAVKADGRLLSLRDYVRMSQGPAGSEATCLRGPDLCENKASGAECRERRTCEEVGIVRVTYVGEERVWDLNTETHHAFFANGVLVHNCIDEIQEMNWDFLGVIHETMSGSEDWGLIQYAGTPKSLDNTIERLWNDSSQAEWLIRCPHGGCGHWNIPNLDHDLVAMIGPAHDNVGPGCPGTVCGKCRRPVDPSTGHWYHFNKELRWSFAGYHVPQIIMPMHYASPVKWAVLVGKHQNLPPNTFFNEVCGESYDAGSKLVTLTELKAACCLPWKNVADEAKAKLKAYKHRVVAVDWGGNGGMVKVGKQKVQRVSFTVVAALGILPSGKVDVIWAYRVLRSLDFDFEVNLIVSAVRTFKCSHVVHDYGGAGAEREYLLLRAGFPHERIIPIKYHGAAAKHPMVYKEPTDEHPRAWYSVDKSWSLGLTCHAIRKGYVRFFEYDYTSNEQPGLVHDFLALQEENVERKGLTDVHYITRNPVLHDDFAQAVNIGCNTLWYMTDGWPDLADANKFQIDQKLLSKISPAKPDWRDF